ncbi:MAG: bifunctional 4-hydroxy-2-oxoglutarate aldolase/2-dehydro-3-deoxy-phosphogluconate aldolase [Planctomycetaceae bacterium]|nr:bifunctional 4-hydroxy-2-oxoglutarate aldolase/2-dehydro-3-deoxy-phosphogluconate aldolase [Planctomycetaceae bacterium]
MARHSRLETLCYMKSAGLVPVFYHADSETAKAVANACCDGGAAILEFTNRGDRAIDVFNALVVYRDTQRPDLILGAGSIVDAPTAAMYIAAGADFIVGPILDEEVARLCNARKVPYCPGCGSATEVHRAHILGAEICKVFPGGCVGGPSFVKSIKGPMPWTEIMPTGGVEPTEESLTAWFNAGVACVGIGGNLLTKELISKGDWAGIRDKVRQTLELIRIIRSRLK